MQLVHDQLINLHGNNHHFINHYCHGKDVLNIKNIWGWNPQNITEHSSSAQYLDILIKWV